MLQSCESERTPCKNRFWNHEESEASREQCGVPCVEGIVFLPWPRCDRQTMDWVPCSARIKGGRPKLIIFRTRIMTSSRRKNGPAVPSSVAAQIVERLLSILLRHFPVQHSHALRELRMDNQEIVELVALLHRISEYLSNRESDFN